jgi:hypothetical protein
MSTVAKEKQPTTGTSLFARSRLSGLGHIALWSSLIRFILAQGGLITLLVLSHGQGLNSSGDIIGIVAGTLISVIVLATRRRWAPLVSTVLAGYVLLVTAMDPFELFDLANPYRGNGGFGIFIVDVLAMALAILAFGGSLGAAIENLSQGRLVPRWLAPIGLYAVVGMVIGALYIGVLR